MYVKGISLDPRLMYATLKKSARDKSESCGFDLPDDAYHEDRRGLMFERLVPQSTMT
jgi:hypothetical protein